MYFLSQTSENIMLEIQTRDTAYGIYSVTNIAQIARDLPYTDGI